MSEVLVDVFGYGCLLGLMWGGARVVAQLMRGESSPQVFRVIDRDGERWVAVWTEPGGKVEKVEQTEERLRRTGTWR